MDAEVDEYLWPLNGDTYSIHWEDITEELHIRRRLAAMREEWNELAQRLQELDGVQRRRLRTEP
jgi:hypothetical protein